jgi:hypothetical protein
MIISREQVMAEFESAYDRESQIKALREEIKEGFELLADDNKISAKDVRQAYSVFKSYKTGKMAAADEAYYEMVAAVEDHFLKEEGGK